MAETDALLPPAFFARPAVVVARDLIGRWLRHGDVVLRITETEAYPGPHDTAAHTRSGRTARNAPMWGPPGRAYVYLCYGLHHLLNLVTDTDGHGAAVLVRSCEPVAGLALIRARRGGREGPVLLTGPGKVGQALALDTSFSHHPVTAPGGLEALHGTPATELLAGPRVGIDYAEPEHRDAPWRLAAAGTRWVSRPNGLTPDTGARPAG
jgi:DNA-3-methyladenine glycosylase